MKRRIGLAAALCMLMIFAACDDPSNVGIGLIGDEQGGVPAIRNVDPFDFANTPLTRPGGSQPRVLAGRVVDPLAGTIEAEGYFDLSTTASSSFRDKMVTSASLRLTPTYAYGDTTQEVTFAIRPIESEFTTPSLLPPDTTYPTGAVIREFSFIPTDSLVVIPMPQSWVQSNDAVLRSTEFASSFHGFRLEQVSGASVVGFAGQSQLRAFAESDSAIYPVTRAYSAIRRTSNVDIPAERVFYQAGVGPIASFELDAETVDASAINQAKLVFQSDTLTLSQKPVGFIRPVITTLDLYGAIGDDRYLLLDRTTIDEKGRFIFDGPTIGQELQRVLLGTRTIDHYELRLPVGSGAFGDATVSSVQGSISVQLFYDVNVPEKAPQGFLTITPLD